MQFRRRPPDEPEINLIPFIDVLLVILIFLATTTSYSKFTQMQVSLPTANTEQLENKPQEITVMISADGQFRVAGQAVDGRNPDLLAQALAAAAQGKNQALVVLAADASVPHQLVMNALEAARQAGLPRLTFAAQKPAGL
ncbi:ExbD/TolR family protein [Amphibiibacter pelophylacis]|uniref:Biopolymer transporter ExbD n=1 Tax=Amphibiibacter pelophylacis TaxID=1799477 RepID=A0ACC6NZ55_9BURK